MRNSLQCKVTLMSGLDKHTNTKTNANKVKVRQMGQVEEQTSMGFIHEPE